MAEVEHPGIEELAQALEEGALEKVASLSSAFHPADLAAFAHGLDEEPREAFFSVLEQERVAEVMEFLAASEVDKTLANLPREEQREVLDSLSDDELVDLLQEVPQPKQEEYLALLSDSKEAVSRRLLLFPETSAGGRMTTAFASVREDMTVRKAIEELSEIKESTEVLSRIYVVDDKRRLLGKVRLRELTFNPRSKLISDVMDDDTMAIDAFADQEEAAQMIAKYDMVALPVVDEDFRLLGVVTHDDAFDILEEESTEDIEKFSAIAGSHAEEGYLQTPVPSHFRRRFFWILPLALLAILSGIVIYSYESVLNQVYLLVIYLPMVVAAGGNTGSQSATTVIRAMALGEFAPSAILKVVWKELRIGLLLGGLLGFCITLVVQFLMPHFVEVPPDVSLYLVAGTVGLALTCQVATSTLLGALLPILARILKLDPALVASPAITTLVDVSGLVIYLGLAKTFLGI